MSRRDTRTGRTYGVWTRRTGSAISVVGHDLRSYTHVQFACRAMSRDITRIGVAFLCNNPKTRVRDEYRAFVPVDWQGWKTVRIPLDSLTKVGEPTELAQAKQMAFRISWSAADSGAKQEVGIDEVALVRVP